MSLLTRIRNVLQWRTVVEPATPDITTGDILCVEDFEVRVVPNDGGAGDVLTSNGAGIAPSWQAPGGGGGGDAVSVNGVACADVNLDDANPAAPAGSINVTWQRDGGATPDDVSGYINVATLEPLIDHSDIDELGWTVSGHTGTASRIAAFDAGGAAAYLQVGVDVQAYDADLAAYAALASTGLVVRTGAGTATTRTIAVSGTGISIADGDGVSGPPTITFDPEAASVEAVSPPLPKFAVQAYDWMSDNVNVAANTGAIAGNLVIYSLHYEEWLGGHTYDAIAALSTAGAGNSAYFAIYSINSDGEPDELLWSSTAQSTNVAPTNHIVTFASGTWTSAGASYKDGSDRLVLARGQSIWKAVVGTGQVTWRILSGAQIRYLGVSTDTTTGYVGYQETVVGAALSDPAVPTSRTTTTLVSLPLRFI